jgi:hypothetical protein
MFCCCCLVSVYLLMCCAGIAGRLTSAWRWLVLRSSATAAAATTSYGSWTHGWTSFEELHLRLVLHQAYEPLFNSVAQGIYMPTHQKQAGNASSPSLSLRVSTLSPNTTADSDEANTIVRVQAGGGREKAPCESRTAYEWGHTQLWLQNCCVCAVITNPVGMHHAYGMHVYCSHSQDYAVPYAPLDPSNHSCGRLMSCTSVDKCLIAWILPQATQNARVAGDKSNSQAFVKA